MAHLPRRCPYCGDRKFMPSQHEACQRCRIYASLPTDDSHKLTGGQWQTVRGIRRWIPDEPPVPEPAKQGRKPLPNFFEWDWPDLIEAYRQHTAGERSAWAIEGNRVYKRETKRRQRATKTEQKEAA